jgi:hypothetical protein
MRNKSLTISLTLLLLCSVLPDLGFSQNALLTIQVQLRKMDDRLGYANEIVRAYGGKAALDYLKQAREMRDLAYQYFESDRPLLIGVYIRKAYFYLELAIRTTLANSGNRMAEQLNEMLRKAEQIVADCPNREAQRLFLDAKKNQEDGLRKLNLGQIERGLEQMRIAYFLSEKVIKLCRQQSPDPADKVIEEKERFGQLLDRALQAVEQTNDTQAQTHISQALKQAEQAETAFQSRKYEKSLDHYYKASRILWRAIEITKTSSNQNPDAALNSELERLNSALAALREQTSLNQKAEFLFRRAEKLRDDAQIALNAGRVKIARQKILLAQAAVGRTHGFLGENKQTEKNPPDRVETELNRLQEKLETARNNLELSQSPQAKQLLQMAEQNATFAQQAVQTKNHTIALERILLAHQFLIRVEESGEKNQEEAYSVAAMRSQFALYDELLAQDADGIREKNNSNAILLLDQAQKYRSQAETAFQKNEMFVAQAFIEMAHQLLVRSREIVLK